MEEVLLKTKTNIAELDLLIKQFKEIKEKIESFKIKIEIKQKYTVSFKDINNDEYQMYVFAENIKEADSIVRDMGFNDYKFIESIYENKDLEESKDLILDLGIELVDKKHSWSNDLRKRFEKVYKKLNK
jgi:hypothetical protein